MLRTRPVRPMPDALAAIAALAVAGLAAGAAAEVTFNRDVAPIIFRSCASCHRPGQSAPFSLLTYEDARKRARQIAAITGMRLMPPWLPSPGYAEFAGDRSLTDEQIRTIRQWAREGAVEGRASDLPPRPEFAEGWQLGEPDLVVEMPAAYTLVADGPDVFRDIVVPVPITETKYVRGVEFDPGNPRAVHHAIIEADPTQSSRRLDAQDEGVGYEGMVTGDSVAPGGHFIGWTPGHVPAMNPEGMSWRLEPETDLIFQFHLLPTGRPETIRARIGLHFSEEPPEREPFILLLGSFDIDIAPGRTDYVVEDSYQLPVDVHALSVYPHAHYLGKDMQGWATLPDGTKKWLIRIKDWDFNWQDQYTFAEPLFLPKDTVIAMKYTYDNSADNVRNPSDPPRRVVFGNRSTDEMGTLLLQVMPNDWVDRRVLAAHYERKFPIDGIARLEEKLEASPDDAPTREQLALLYLRLGEIRKARFQLEESLRLDPSSASAHTNLAIIERRLGRVQVAIGHFEKALSLEPDNLFAHNNLAWTLATFVDPAEGRAAEALEHARRAVELADEDSGALLDTLAAAYAANGRFEDAVRTANEALALVASPRRADLALRIRQRRDLYLEGQPYRAQ